VHQCFTTVHFSLLSQSSHVVFFLCAETPMPVSAMHRVLLSTSALSDEKLPLVNNGESTATRNTKISYRQCWLAQRIRRQQREVANKLPQQKQLPLHFVSCSLSLMRACVCFAVHGIASTRCRATKGQSLFAALVYCGSVF
jgi:hypothetical protein